MDPTTIDEATAHFQALTNIVPLHAIRSEADYEHAVSVLNALLDAGAADERSPLAGLVNLLGCLIGDYEDGDFSATQDQ